MTKKESFLVLNEEGNAMDYLVQSLIFLSQVEQNNYFLKWFVIAFHGALHSFMLLVLQKVNPMLIYEKPPKYKTQEDCFDPFDGYTRNFLDTYSYLKDRKYLGNTAFTAEELHDISMKELNNKLRNQFIHFKPMSWGAEAWYPAGVCYPLLKILRFCLASEGISLSRSQKETAVAYVDSLDRLLVRHIE